MEKPSVQVPTHLAWPFQLSVGCVDWMEHHSPADGRMRTVRRKRRSRWSAEELLRHSEPGVALGQGEQMFFFRRNSACPFRARWARDPGGRQRQGHFMLRGTTAVAPQEEGRSLGKGHPGGWAGPGEGSPLDALQRVVHVAALPLHKGFAQAAGVSVDLTAPVFTDVIFVQQRQ